MKPIVVKTALIAVMLSPVLFSCKKSSELTAIKPNTEASINSIALCTNTFTCTINKAAMVQRDSVLSIPFGYTLYTNTNYFNYPIFKAERWSTSTHIFDSRSLLKFNLPPNFFSGFTFCQADLMLYEDVDPNSMTYLGVSNPYTTMPNQINNTAKILRVRNAWNGTTVTWNTQPLTFSASAATVTSIGTGTAYSSADNRTVNITGIMQAVQTAGVDRGIEIIIPTNITTNSARQFGSKTATPASVRAQLIFYY